MGTAAAPVGDGPLHVISATSVQMFLEIKSEQTAGPPRYRDEMELTLPCHTRAQLHLLGHLRHAAHAGEITLIEDRGTGADIETKHHRRPVVL